MSLDIEELKKELTFKTSRSGGAGGQHVNKVETRVTLIWDFAASKLFSPEQKEVLQRVFTSRINAAGQVQLDVSETRSQANNKRIAVDRLINLLDEALQPIRKRIGTKIPRTKVLERLDRKKKQSEKKSARRWRLD